MQISVVLPVYNSASTLRTIVGAILSSVDEIASDYELILINDGSSDGSWQIIQELASSVPRIVPINLSRNYSEHNATLCGIRAATFPITVTLDDDLQNPPKEIVHIVNKLEEGFDVVYGTPRKEQHGLFRDLASQLTKWVMQKSMGVDVARNISSFRAFRTELRDAFTSVEGDFVNIDVLLSWSAARYASVKVNHRPRENGQSTYNLSRLIRHAMNMIIGFSAFPLQLAAANGLICTSVGVALLCYAAINWLLQGSIAIDVPFIASVILIFLGAQLIAIGMVGEYLVRMYQSVVRKPPLD